MIQAKMRRTLPLREVLGRVRFTRVRRDFALELEMGRSLPFRLTRPAARENRTRPPFPPSHSQDNRLNCYSLSFICN